MRRPGARMAPATRSGMCRHVRRVNSGAKGRKYAIMASGRLSIVDLSMVGVVYSVICLLCCVQNGQTLAQFGYAVPRVPVDSYEGIYNVSVRCTTWMHE